MKRMLAHQHPVVAFVMCKGDIPHSAYECGPFDHIEPFWGLYSNHNLMDPAVYDDDYIVHGSDYGPDGDKNLGYFRRMNSMVDTTAMDGNCKNALPNLYPPDVPERVPRNEMYPCFNDQNNYGTALMGLNDPLNKTLPLYLKTDVMNDPDVRIGEVAIPMDLVIHISGLTVGTRYRIKKYQIDTWPKNSSFGDKSKAHISFYATSTTHMVPEQLLGDMETMSDSDAYFACVKFDDFPTLEGEDENLIVLE